MHTKTEKVKSFYVKELKQKRFFFAKKYTFLYNFRKAQQKTREYKRQGQSTHRFSYDDRRKFIAERNRHYNDDERRKSRDKGINLFLYNYFTRFLYVNLSF